MLVVLPVHSQVSKDGSSPVDSIYRVGIFFCTKVEKQFIHITFVLKQKGGKGYRLTWYLSAFIVKIGNCKGGGRSGLKQGCGRMKMKVILECFLLSRYVIVRIFL